jgi:hypothetical protein
MKKSNFIHPQKEKILNILLVIYIILAIFGTFAVSFYYSEIIRFTLFIPLFSLLPFLYTIFLAWQTEGLKNSLIFIVSVFLSTLMFEYFSVITGFICGKF